MSAATHDERLPGMPVLDPRNVTITDLTARARYCDRQARGLLKFDPALSAIFGARALLAWRYVERLNIAEADRIGWPSPVRISLRSAP